MQVKSNEDDTPWDPKPEDQRVDADNFKLGLDQLERDVLRFCEMLPDVRMADVTITTNIAFPLAPRSAEREALTKEDFLPENAQNLLRRLGVSMELLGGYPTSDNKDAYKRIICRYLGAHAKVPAKISMNRGLEVLELAMKGTDSSFQVHVSDPTFTDQGEIEKMKKAVTRDAWMKEIRNAVLTPKFGKKFQEQNKGIPLKDLKHDKDRFLKQSSTKSFPLFGLPVINAVLKAADEQTAHQGSQPILDLLKKEKYVFYDQTGAPLDKGALVDEHIRECTDCFEVQVIKDKVPPCPSKFLLQIPEEIEHDALLYADKRHRGFADAFKRLQTWADFPDMERKVTETIINCNT